jgi:hypothetical protein
LWVIDVIFVGNLLKKTITEAIPENTEEYPPFRHRIDYPATGAGKPDTGTELYCPASHRDAGR